MLHRVNPKQAGQLDNISRRFAFFRRLLASYDTDFSHIFPTEWKVGCALTVKWGDVTRYPLFCPHHDIDQLSSFISEDLSSALSKAGPKLTVTVLLDSLQQTTDFESFLGRKFGIPVSILFRLISLTRRLNRSVI